MTSLFSFSVALSSLVVGETSKSYKVSTIFIGSFADKKLATRNSDKKYQLIPKVDFEILYGNRIEGLRPNGYPQISDVLCDKDSNALYKRDWNELETWEVI